MYVTFTVLLVIAVIIIRRRVRFNIRKMLIAAPFPDEWQEIVNNNVPIYKHLPEDLKDQLHGLINIFLVGRPK